LSIARIELQDVLRLVMLKAAVDVHLHN
jgi:hypothetical protein